MGWPAHAASLCKFLQFLKVSSMKFSADFRNLSNRCKNAILATHEYDPSIFSFQGKEITVQDIKRIIQDPELFHTLSYKIPNLGKKSVDELLFVVKSL